MRKELPHRHLQAVEFVISHGVTHVQACRRETEVRHTERRIRNSIVVTRPAAIPGAGCPPSLVPSGLPTRLALIDQLAVGNLLVDAVRTDVTQFKYPCGLEFILHTQIPLVGQRGTVILPLRIERQVRARARREIYPARLPNGPSSRHRLRQAGEIIAARNCQATPHMERR